MSPPVPPSLDTVASVASVASVKATAEKTWKEYMTRINAEREARRGTSDPTYLVYALGKKILMELREEAKVKWGKDFTLQRFHDAALSCGYPPVPIVRQLLLCEDAAR